MFDKDPSDAAFTWYFLPLGHSINLAASYDLILGGYGDDLLSRGTLNPLNGWAKDRTKPLTKEQVLARRDVELRRVDDPSLPLDELGFYELEYEEDHEEEEDVNEEEEDVNEDEKITSSSSSGSKRSAEGSPGTRSVKRASAHAVVDLRGLD
jgi:hypothetical protein